MSTPDLARLRAENERQIDRLADGLHKWREDAVHFQAEYDDAVAENEHLRAVVARVEALADEYGDREAANHDFVETYHEGARDAWDEAEAMLRAALAGTDVDAQ